MTWLVHPVEEFESHSDTWDHLVASAGYPALLRSEFLTPAIVNLGCEHGRLLFGYRADRLSVVALMQRIAPGRWQVYQPSQLPLGAWAMTADTCWESALGSLLHALPGLALSVSVMQQDPMLISRPVESANLEVIDYVPTGWVDVAGSFEEFWQARGKNLRQNLRKQVRKLEGQGRQLQFEFLAQPADIEAAFADFAVLESAGWKAGKGSAITAESAQGRFYRDMLRAFAGRGAAFAARLWLDDRPIAVDFGVRDGSVVVILKTTYDEGLKGYSPAQLLHERAFEYFFERLDVQRIEFYGRMMEWHTRWTDQSRILFHLNYFRWPIVRSIRDLAKRVSGEVRASTP